MDFEIHPVSIDQIVTTDDVFKITTKSDITDLALSISAIGLLQPPVLKDNGSTYTVVCGFRRVEACRKLAHTTIPARIFGPDCPSIDCVRLAIAENASQRQLDVVEQSRAYALIAKFVDHPPSRMELANVVGLPASQSAMERILPVADMPIALNRALLSGKVALPVALQIHQLSSTDAMALTEFFNRITAGLNVQRELLDLIVDISRRDGCAIADLIQRDDVTRVLSDPETPAPQKVQALRKMIKAIRFPALSQAEANFHQMVQSVKLDPHIQIQPPRFFEGKNYRVSMTLSSRRQLKRLQLELDKLADHPHLLPE
ncbi:MAG: ParB/RepB/Spo0J family partition protein [Desulfosarcina sp.]|jgi:ParB/RepB/Spo0J family partition protein